MSEQKSEIKAGDVVVLKSGGPKMTVDAMGGMGAECLWFDAGQVGGPLKGKFTPTSLRKVDEDSTKA